MLYFIKCCTSFKKGDTINKSYVLNNDTKAVLTNLLILHLEFLSIPNIVRSVLFSGSFADYNNSMILHPTETYWVNSY